MDTTRAKQRVRKYTQCALAGAIGVDRQTIRNWRKKGKLKPAGKSSIWLSDFHFEELRRGLRLRRSIAFRQEELRGLRKEMKRRKVRIAELRAEIPTEFFSK